MKTPWCPWFALMTVAPALLLAGPAEAGRHPETLRFGDTAPDFTLKSPDGKQSVRLADFRGVRPVVLIFGSYTCPPFRDVYPTLERLYETYGDSVAFFYIYIREAHAEDGWKMPRNQREGIAIKDPKTMEERVGVAQKACAFFKTKIPGLVDTMDDKTDRAYAAWPSRVFLVDVNGKIVVRGEPGPRGLVPGARAIEQWLEKNVKRTTVNVPK
jgi:thiol-disulfide isomerase/thioredoxin